MSTIDLNHVVSMNNVSVMNSNFDIIEAAINGDIIHVKGGQNVMQQDLDLNGHSLLNVTTNQSNPNSLLTVGGGDSRYYKQHEVPLPVVPGDAANKQYIDSFNLPSGMFTQTAPGAVARTFLSKDRDIKSLKDFAGDGVVTDWSAAITAADAWITANGGGTIFVPVGTYPFLSDVRLLASKATWVGEGAGSRLQGVGGARVCVGNAIAVPNSPKVIKSGTKSIQVTMANLSIKPSDNHSGECLLLDYVDNFIGYRLDVGPFNNTGSTKTTGIKLNWTQYTEINQCVINVNSRCLHVMQPATMTENEDHYTIRNCWLYIGKVTFTGDTPACIYTDRDSTRSASIFHFNVDTCHLGKFTSGGTALTYGIVCANANTGTTRTFHSLKVTSSLFELVDSCIDFATLATNLDNSRFFVDSTSFLNFTQTAIKGGNVNNATGTCNNTYFQTVSGNGAKGVDGARIFWDGVNYYLNVDTFLVQSPSNHRYMAKTGLSLQNAGSATRLSNSNVQAVTTAATTQVVTHGLLAGQTPNVVIATPSWGTTCFVTGITSTQFTLNFGTAAPAGANCYWFAEVRDN